MLHFSKWKIITIIGICLLGLLGGVPNFFNKDTLESWPGFLPTRQIGLGLDLQGGAHLLLAMDSKELRKDWLKTIKGDVRAKLRKSKIYTAARPAVVDNAIRVRPAKASDLGRAFKDLQSLREVIGGTGSLGGSYDLEIKQLAGGMIEVRPTEAGLKAKESSAISASIETVRKRIDELGTKEPNIVRQGASRILVQVPGVRDPQELKDTIGQTGSLTFQFVHPNMTAAEAKRTRIPSGYIILPSNDGGDELIEDRLIVSGEDLVDAQPGFDSRNNEPVMTFRFNQHGARAFGRATAKNVGRRFAIVLNNGLVTQRDNEGKPRRDSKGNVIKRKEISVISAPVIREPILGGTGQISGSFTAQQTNRLAIQVRSGALPASLDIIEERIVGPSLGHDSILAGETAAIIGGLAVIGFMIFAYGLFGIFALMAVGLNIALILSLMSWLGSTLTLPGIAGIVLTVGMAVDANVLIYERIREEMRNGKSPTAAIDSGFSRALGTIVDSNLTTLIAGLVMFWLGSGPIRGFAVTLSLGIMTTVFTAFTVTRLLVSLWLKAKKKKSNTVPAPI